MQIARLFETVYILLDKRTITAKELAEHFEVSVRTIYRDIDVLSQAGIPLYTSKGKGGGISLMDHYVLNKSLLTQEEQEDILTSLSSMQLLQDKQSSKVIQKLGSIFQKEPMDWIDVDFHDWSLQNQQTKFDVLKDAIFTSKKVAFQYINLQGEESKRIVEPMKLLFQGQSWYLWGYCMERSDVRFFRLSRMRSLQKLDQSFVRRKITIKKELPSTSNTIKIRLKVSPEIAFRIYDEFTFHDGKYTDGYLIVNTSINDDKWIIDYLLSFGNKLEVLAPKDLRDEMKSMIQSMNQIYEP